MPSEFGKRVVGTTAIGDGGTNHTRAAMRTGFIHNTSPVLEAAVSKLMFPVYQKKQSHKCLLALGGNWVVKEARGHQETYQWAR